MARCGGGHWPEVEEAIGQRWRRPLARGGGGQRWRWPLARDGGGHWPEVEEATGHWPEIDVATGHYLEVEMAIGHATPTARLWVHLAGAKAWP